MASPVSSVEVESRTGRSFRTKALHSIISPIGTRLVKPGKPQPPGSPELHPHSSTKHGCKVTHRIVEEINIYDVTSEDRKDAPTSNGATESATKRRQIYYFSGGAFQSLPTGDHWKLCKHLAVELSKHGVETTVSLVSYPLAPNTPASLGLSKLEKMYYALLKSSRQQAGEEIILAGDSAGGNIALSLTLQVLTTDPSAPAPDSLFLISPAVDMRNINPRMKEIDHQDPLLSFAYVDRVAKTWMGSDMSADDPRVSPVLGDLAGFAKRNVRVNAILGGFDVLQPDAQELRKKLQVEGVKGKWLEWEQQMHCFPLAFSYKLPESVQAVEWMIEVISADR